MQADFFNTKGNISLTLTDIRTQTRPKFEDFECANLIGFKWEQVRGQAERYAAVTLDGKLHTGRITQYGIFYNSKVQRETLFERLNHHFQIIGIFPAFTQVLCTTFGFPIEDFSQKIDNYYKNKICSGSISAQPLQELAPKLSAKFKLS